MNKQIVVYALYSTSDPERIRYIGVTSDLLRRIKDHLNDAKKYTGRGSYKCAWINKEISNGFEIFYKVLEHYNSHEEAYIAEKWWIAHLKQTTVGLTNLSEGGDGYLVNPWDNPVTRTILTQHAKDRMQDPIYKSNIDNHWKAYWSDPVNREAQSKRVKEYWATVEGSKRRATPKLKKQRGPRNKRVVIDEHRERSRKQMTEFWSDPENKKKRSEALKNSPKTKVAALKAKERWKDPEYKAQRSMKISLGRRLAKAKRNNWLLEIIS